MCAIDDLIHHLLDTLETIDHPNYLTARDDIGIKIPFPVRLQSQLAAEHLRIASLSLSLPPRPRP